MKTDLEQAIAAWHVDGAPRGFADRVMQNVEQPSTPKIERAWPWRSIALVTIVATAAALLVAWWPNRVPTSGRLDATERTTVELPSAIVVAEAGSRLAWSVDDDDAVHVQQSDGRVFYRVERPSVFSVTTSLGRIDVEGTAFEVEVEPMQHRTKTIAATAAGIAAAALVTVTLYEGRVVVASDQGTRRLAPGEQARLRPGEQPEVGDRETLASLRHENERLRDELHARSIRTSDDEASIVAVPDAVDADPDAPRTEKERLHRCALTINGGLGCPMVDPSPEVLERRADCGVVVYDRPSAIEAPDVEVTRLVELVGLDEREQARLQEGSRAFYEFTRGQFEGIYTELGGDPTLAAKLSAVALSAEIDRLVDRDDPEHAEYDRVSEWYSAVLAGREPPRRLEEMSASDRHAYLWTATGDLYEEFIADYVGADRAHELRQATDGWEGNRGMQGIPHCPDD